MSYEQGADLRIAPFIGVRWAQVGLELTSINSNFSGVKSGSNEIVGFTRLYAPVSARAEPFLEVFGTTPTVRQPTTGGSKLSNFGGSAGLRHYVTNGSAIDVGTTWRWYARTGVDNAGSGRAHDVSLQVRLVTQIRYLAGPL
ncbi:MAG: hypothetical protein ABJE47_21775 [bacterium]